MSESKSGQATTGAESTTAKPGRPRAKAADGEAAVLALIEAMDEPSRSMGQKLHRIIRENGPMLTPRSWYGMPGYAKDGKVLCFFRGAEKFKERYMTFGFDDPAHLDDGNMWPIAYALTELTPAEETRIAELIKKAVG